MTYRYELSGKAQRYLRRLPPGGQAQVLRSIRQLCEDPMNPGTSIALHGPLAGLRRARVGDLRLVFEVIGQDSVHIRAIRPRGDVYKG